jgi:acyl carrier protein
VSRGLGDCIRDRAFPLTANGKLNRLALPVPNRARPEIEKAFLWPRDMLELQLTAIWENVLDIKPIGVKDNFFDLGGHSLLAVHLFAQIEKAFGKNLPLATLFQTPTVGQLADILRQQGWSAPRSSLVALQPDGHKPPFFIVHALGGHILGYHELVRRLGRDQSIYGLQAQGLDGEQAVLTRIKDMANHYINEIRTVLPEGPYLLGGYSLGGIVAFEMARQLEAQGQKIALLALLDTAPPTVLNLFAKTKLFRDKVSYFAQRIPYHWGIFQDWDLKRSSITLGR